MVDRIAVEYREELFCGNRSIPGGSSQQVRTYCQIPKALVSIERGIVNRCENQ